MRKFLALLIMAGLAIGVSASAEIAPVIVTKQGKWQTWGPNGPSGTLADTTTLGAAVDTTQAIYIGDMAFGLAYTNGPAASAPTAVIKVSITADGLMDNVDSLYYRIEASPDGNHWTSVLAAEAQNNLIGAIAGIDQGATVVGTTTNNCASFYIRVDPDQVVDGGSGTAAIFNHSWILSPYIRLHIRSLASDVFNGARLWVTYAGYRESH